MKCGAKRNFYIPCYALLNYNEMNLEEIRKQIVVEFNWIYDCLIDGNEIIIEEKYEMGEDEKNSDDCCDTARENGEMIIEKFPMLELSNYYCHRNKYAIVNLKVKVN